MKRNSFVHFISAELLPATFGVSLAGIPLIVFAGVAYRSYVWLKSGFWPEITLMSLDLNIFSSWAGVQMIPLEILVILALLAIAFISYAVVRGMVSAFGIVEFDEVEPD